MKLYVGGDGNIVFSVTDTPLEVGDIWYCSLEGVSDDCITVEFLGNTNTTILLGLRNSIGIELAKCRYFIRKTKFRFWEKA